MGSIIHCGLAGAAALGLTGAAQIPPTNGMRPADLRAHAIVGATVHVAPGQVLEGATILIRDGVIEAVGASVSVPADARRWDYSGLTVYPGLIDAAVMVDGERQPRSDGDHWNSRVHPQVSLAAQAVPSSALRKELRGLGFTVAAAYPRDGAFRGSGVVVALADEAPHVLAYQARAAMAAAFDHGGGRGAGYPGSLMGAIALLRQALLDAQWHAECRRVYQEHPEGNEPAIRADALVAMDDVINRRQRLLIDVDDELNALRAARLAREFSLDAVLLGSGLEMRRLGEIVGTGLPLIVPLDFPKRPEFDSLAAAETVSLRDMMTWEQAPTNPRRLLGAGATVALTTHRLKKRGDFARRLHQAIEHGLTEAQALAALTTTPAQLLGLQGVLGTLEPGKAANLVVADGSLFVEKPKVRDVWINGRRYEIDAQPRSTLVMSGTLRTDLGIERLVEVDTTKRSVSLKTTPGAKGMAAKQVTVQQDQISFVVEGQAFDADGYARLSGAIVDGRVIGSGALADGRRFAFTIDPGGAAPASPGAGAGSDQDRGGGAWDLLLESGEGEIPATLRVEVGAGGSATGSVKVRDAQHDLGTGTFLDGSGELRLMAAAGATSPAKIEATITGDAIDGTVLVGDLEATFTGKRSAASSGRRDAKAPFEMPPQELVSPLGEYGLAAPPEARDVLVRGATLWTCGPQGVLEDADLLVRGGRIVAMGRDLAMPSGGDGDALVIDAAGKHVTPGLIDCHSHTGISGNVNEGAQANTAEVRIGDVIDPDDIDWYRQLAGGLIAANQLHGSANPIGGQNSVVKLKWGGPAEAYPIDGAIPGIKFALGENVKRNTDRYPNTRMGVETFIRDAFTAAQDYAAEWERFTALATEQRQATMPPRRDLELEALLEILGGQRLVHCHSYRQDEILMLIRVADELGFTIGTFQHVLEGYKVADAIAAHGAGASSFSDWWAYKMEVMDAIPYNGALMTDVGVTVSFNSDSSELARRMNTEAAKAVRYGGLEPPEALKVVTINPAKQLRIDQRTGSLEVGKDGDFVIWSDHPLSTYARCEQTWIEGARYFDLESDMAMRERDGRERQRLIQKILTEAHGEPPTLVQDSSPQGPRPTDMESAPLRLLEARRHWMEELMRRGIQPDEIRPGCCAESEDVFHAEGGHR